MFALTCGAHKSPMTNLKTSVNCKLQADSETHIKVKI